MTDTTSKRELTFYVQGVGWLPYSAVPVIENLAAICDARDVERGGHESLISIINTRASQMAEQLIDDPPWETEPDPDLSHLWETAEHGRLRRAHLPAGDKYRTVYRGPNEHIWIDD